MKFMVQGLGLLRLSIGDNLRLHIWDKALEYPGVSKMHTHSWDLTSYVVCGELRNQRFIEVSRGIPHWRRRLRCGVGCEWVGPAEVVFLRSMPIETYRHGQTYTQKADEIHVTDAVPGTITLMNRQYDGPAGEANIYWPILEEWGTAEPREATQAEVAGTISKSLRLLFPPKRRWWQRPFQPLSNLFKRGYEE